MSQDTPAAARNASLAHLAEGMRRAAEAGDLAAVKVANDAIGKLLAASTVTPRRSPRTEGIGAEVLAFIAEVNATGQGVPGRRALARALGRSVNTTRPVLDHLLALGTVENRGQRPSPDLWITEAPSQEIDTAAPCSLLN